MGTPRRSAMPIPSQAARPGRPMHWPPATLWTAELGTNCTPGADPAADPAKSTVVGTLPAFHALCLEIEVAPVSFKKSYNVLTGPPCADTRTSFVLVNFHMKAVPAAAASAGVVIVPSFATASTVFGGTFLFPGSWTAAARRIELAPPGDEPPL